MNTSAVNLQGYSLIGRMQQMWRKGFANQHRFHQSFRRQILTSFYRTFSLVAQAASGFFLSANLKTGDLSPWLCVDEPLLYHLQLIEIF
jgi:hypothetical protein